MSPPMEVLPGIALVPIRTPTLPPATHTNCYFLGETEWVIIDPAASSPREKERLTALIRERQVAGSRLREIWLTHHHRDHVGAVMHLRNAFGILTAAHPLTRESLMGSIPVDREIHDGETLHLPLKDGRVARWTALHTPGHARGHLCFYEEDTGVLITGDTIVGEGTVVVAPPDGDMADYMGTLRRLRALQASMLLPGHGAPIRQVRERIDFYLMHRQEREDAILATLARGPSHPWDLVLKVYTDISPLAYPLAEQNVRAHLAKLLAEGRVGRLGRRFVKV